MLDQLFLIFVYGGVVLGIFVVLLINSKGARTSRANIFLSVLLVAFAFSILHIQYAGSVLNHFSVRAYHIGDPTFLLIPPLLWFYTEALTGKRVRLIKSVFHFLPALSIMVLSLSLQVTEPDNGLTHFLNGSHRVPMIIFWAVVVIQFSCYQFLIHRKWSDYQQTIKQEVSNTENVNISWVKFFMNVFLVINIFFLAGLVVVIHLSYTLWLWRAVAVLFSFSIFALGYKGILQREIVPVTPADNPAQNAEPEVMAPAPDQQLVNQIVSYMITKKPYLDPELSLSSLAKQLEMGRSQLSQLINSGTGQNFYDFVNKYRVEEVKRLMTDPQMKNYNLLGIALEAGFKSKSTFNLIFKRFTGLTPTEFRKNISG